jgi:hypothetical protein
MGRKKGVRKYKGCNEDCLNCKYPDCYKPTYQMRTDRTFFISKANKERESQSKMYTLSLGKYGGTSANISKKYFR